VKCIWEIPDDVKRAGTLFMKLNGKCRIELKTVKGICANDSNSNSLFSRGRRCEYDAVVALPC